MISYIRTPFLKHEMEHWRRRQLVRKLFYSALFVMTICCVESRNCILGQLASDNSDTDQYNIILAVNHRDNMPERTQILLSNAVESISKMLDDTINSYNQGLLMFSNESDVLYFDKTHPAMRINTHARYEEVTRTAAGCNVTGAMKTVLNIFTVSMIKNEEVPNICILLTTSQPDDKLLATNTAQELRDSGINLFVVAIGDGVYKRDIRDLGASDYEVFEFHNDGNQLANASILASQIKSSMITVVPRYGYCFFGRKRMFAFMDMKTSLKEVENQLKEFGNGLNMFETIEIINSNAESYRQEYLSTINGHVIEHTKGSLPNALGRHCFSRDFTDKNNEIIIVIVADMLYANVTAINNVLRACVNAGSMKMYVTALGIGGEDIREQFADIVCDPTGIVMVPDITHLADGLDSINRRTCPAQLPSVSLSRDYTDDLKQKLNSMDWDVLCNLGWQYHDGMCYRRELTTGTWMQSKSQCESLNANLASITSKEVLNWLTDNLQIDGSPIYIGLRKYRLDMTPMSSQWRWQNGKPLIMTNWSTSGEVPQPDGAMQEACVAWYHEGWRDIACSLQLVSKQSLLCEMDAGNKTTQIRKAVQIRPLWTVNECSGKEEKMDGIPAYAGDDCTPRYELRPERNYNADVFRCENGELISKYLTCDGINHCRDASDERNCSASCGGHQFKCGNRRCVSLALVCDSWNDCGDNSDENECVYPDCGIYHKCDNGECLGTLQFNSECDLVYDCYDKSDESRCSAVCEGVTCNDGTCIPRHWVRDGEVDCSGREQEDERTLLEQHLNFTERDVSELIYLFVNKDYIGVRPDCTMMPDGFGKLFKSFIGTECNGFIDCPVGFHQCPSSYCIPIQNFCDGVMHCIDGEDEMMCDEFECPGYFRCPGVQFCVHPSRICDGTKDCPNGKDEVLCNFTCPSNCSCNGGAVVCGAVNLEPLSTDTRKILFESTRYNVKHKGAFSSLNLLIHVTLSNVGLTSYSLHFSPNLKTLNISNNQLTSLTSSIFLALNKLEMLDVSSNPIHKIENATFTGLVELKELFMRKTFIKTLGKDTFLPLINLEKLDISGSGISSVVDDTFLGLTNLKYLVMQKNTITSFSRGIFNGLENVKEIQSEVFSLCCSVVRPKSVDTCISPKASIASCSDLMANDFLRASIWVLSVASLMGNIMSIILRLCWEKSSMKNGFGIFVTHLCISDFLMGVYLLTIAIVDIKYMGIYIWHDFEWRNSIVCRFAGFIATLSSEASTFFICLITLDRFIVIKFPFSQLRFAFVSANVASIGAWVVSFVIAVIPLLPNFNHWTFYSKNAACLALPFFTEKESGWIYSVAIFIGLNFVAFIIIALGQYSIYRAVKQGSIISSKERSSKEMAVARRLLLVVATDFLCWFPIGVMSLLALSGYTIGGDTYAWTAVFVLPVNSALNPFLYSIPAIIQKIRSKKNISKSASTSRTGPELATVRVGNPNPDAWLVDDYWAQLESQEERIKLVHTIMVAVQKRIKRLPPDDQRPNSVFISTSANRQSIKTIWFSTQKEHQGGIVTALVLDFEKALETFKQD